MIRSAFEVTAQDIKNLGSTGMVRLLEYLLLAEARLTGIPLADINVPLQITIADGGEDARIAWQEGVERTDFLPRRSTSFQSKATNVTASSLKRECWEPKTGTAKRPPVLRAVMKSVIDAKGAYIVFTHAPLTPQKIDELRAIIVAGIQEAGGDASQIGIDIYDSNRIARWTNTHPSVTAWVLEVVHGRSLGPFQVLSSWNQQLDFKFVPWVDDDQPRFALLDTAIAAHEGRDPDKATVAFSRLHERVVGHLAKPQAIVRIAGASGLGKTRLAHALASEGEALRNRLLSNAVLFSDFTVHGDDVLRSAEALAQSGRDAVLIVDECPDTSHAKLADITARTDARVRLITIDVETRRTSSVREMIISVEPAKDELIDMIVSGCANELSHADHAFIRELADGFPRMAVRAVEALREQRDPLRSVDDLVDRILWGRSSPDGEARRAVSVASLFQVVEVSDGGTDLPLIAENLAEQTDTRMREHLERFKLRGIVFQGGRFIQVQPVPLASHLGKKCLKVLGAAKIGAFFKAAAPKLRERFLNRLKLFDTAPEAKAFARELLKVEGIGNLADLNSEFGSEALHALVHVEPDAAMAALDRGLGKLSVDELKEFQAGRRHIVWALEKLAFRRATFDKAARLLLRLGAAETERWSNNASGQFKQLFQLMLSGTEAEPALRLQVLDDGLLSADSRVQNLCVDALGEMVSTFSYTRSGGAEVIGTQRHLRDWRPTLVRDQWEFFREAISRLTALAVGGGPHATKSKAILGQSIRGLLNAVPLDDIAQMVRKVVAKCGFWIEGLRALNEWLYFDRNEAPADVVAKIRALYQELVPTLPIDRALLYASGWDTDFHDPDLSYHKDERQDNDHDYASRMAGQIAEEIASSHELVEQCLDRMTTATLHGGYAFGKRLAASVSDPVALFDSALVRAAAASTLDDTRFLCGLLSGVESRDPQKARACLSRALDVPSLVRHRTRLLGALSTQTKDVETIVDLLRGNEIDVARTVELSWGRGLDGLTAEGLVPLLEELERHGSKGMWAVLEVVHMYLHSRQDIPPELATIVKRILTLPTLPEGATRGNGYTFEEEYKRLKRHGHVDGNFARSMMKQVIHIHLLEDTAVRFDLGDYARKITADLIGSHPTEVWDEVINALGRTAEDRPWRISDAFNPKNDDRTQAGPLFGLPRDRVLDWVRQRPSERASFVAGWLPLRAQVDGRCEWHPSIMSFLDEFGDQKGVLSTIGIRLYPGAWWGSVVPFLEPWLALLQQLDGHRLSQVREWAAKTAKSIRSEIDAGRARDAEQNLGIY